ncbi:MAG: PAS domain S-box protein [Desulfobacterales bacterium]|nr:MAG: PAS domain S-box protein [Desulfobacterales bacterium]
MVKEKEPPSKQFDTHHRRAARALREIAELLNRIPGENARALAHELQVHQAELEMQNEELNRAQTELEQSRRRYYELYELAPVGYFTLDRKGLILEANLTAADLLGIERSGLTHEPFAKFVAPADQGAFQAHCQKVHETGSRQACDLKLIKKNATPFHAQLVSLVAADAAGHRNQMRIAIIDISERKRTEDELQTHRLQLERQVQNRTAELKETDGQLAQKIVEHSRAEKQLKLLSSAVEQSSEGIAVADLEGNLIYLNQAFARVHGYSPEELVGKHLSIFHTPEQLPAVEAANRMLKETGEFSGEISHVRRDGTAFPTLMHNSLLRDAHGRPAGMIGTLRDISDIKQAERELKASEERFRTVADFTYDWEYWIGPDGEYVYISPSCERITGYRPEEFQRNPGLLEAITHPEDRQMIAKQIANRLRSREVLSFDFRIITRSRAERWLAHICQPVYNAEGVYLGRRATVRDITDRKRAEEQLRQSTAMLQAVFDGISEPLILLGRDMGAKMINRAAAEYYGIPHPEDAIGKRCCRVLEESAASCRECEIPSAILSGQNITLERQGRMDPSRLEEVVIYPVGETNGGNRDAIVRISDITEAKLFEKQLIQSEKMASLGILVSSIAHEINNPNSFISFNIPILKEYLEELIPLVDRYAEHHPDFELFNMPYAEFREDIFKLLNNISHGSKRINACVSNLREFSQAKDKGHEDWVDPRIVIERVLAICHVVIRKTVKSLIQNIPPNMPLIYTDSNALEQILLNLLVNAAQAADKPDSRVELSVSIGQTWREHLIVEVRDNGCGMDAKTQRKIFDPFFTTKSIGEGTGLGLYVCYNLVESLRGRIEVESEPGEGSTFRVILPDKERRQRNRN